MTNEIRERVDKLIEEINDLKQYGIGFTVLEGKYGDELSIVDNKGASPSDFQIHIIDYV